MRFFSTGAARAVFRAEDGVGWGVTLTLFLLILLPLAAVILQIFFPGIFFGERGFAGWGLVLEVFHRPLWSQSLVNSWVLASGTALLGSFLGGVLAMVRHSWRFPGSRWLDTASWALIITPSFILAQGWVLFANRNGIASQLFGLSWVADLIFQPLGLILVMSLSKYPLAYLSVSAAMEWNVSRYGDAARLCGARPGEVWRTIRMPLLLPAFLAGGALVFMDTIGDFGLPASLAAVYRFPTLPYSIYTALYTAPIRFDMAGVLSLYLVMILAVVMALQLLLMQRGRYDFLTSRAERQRPHPISHAGVVGLVNLFFLAVAVGIPFGSNLLVSFMKNVGGGLHWENWTLQYYAAVLQLDSTLLEGLWHSLYIAGMAALCGLLVGFAVAYILIFTDFRLKKWIDLLSIVSLAVPGVVLGIGYIFVWNQPWLERFNLILYGTPWILVLASIAGAIPLTTRLMVGSMTKIPKSLLSAAALQGATLRQRLQQILMPLLGYSMITAALSAFGSSIFDLAVSTILYPPGFLTLPVVINKAFENLDYGYATAATMVGGGLTLMVILSIYRFYLYFMNQYPVKEEDDAALSREQSA